MKKIINRIIPVIILITLLLFSPSFTRSASAAYTGSLEDNFEVTSITDSIYSKVYNANTRAFFKKVNLPIIIRTYNIGYGSLHFKVNGYLLDSDEYTLLERTPIKNPDLPANWNSRIGYEEEYEINPDTDKLESGLNSLDATFEFTRGGTKSQRVWFVLQ